MTTAPVPSHRLYRIQRTADMIRYELARIMKKANDPRFNQITITHVELSKDFAHAKIYFTLLDETILKSIQAGLKKAMGFFRYELAHSAAFRSVPKLEFLYTPPLAGEDEK